MKDRIHSGDKVALAAEASPVPPTRWIRCIAETPLNLFRYLENHEKPKEPWRSCEDPLSRPVGPDMVATPLYYYVHPYVFFQTKLIQESLYRTIKCALPCSNMQGQKHRQSEPNPCFPGSVDRLDTLKLRGGTAGAAPLLAAALAGGVTAGSNLENWAGVTSGSNSIYMRLKMVENSKVVFEVAERSLYPSPELCFCPPK